jgi:hypothetical protein
MKLCLKVASYRRVSKTTVQNSYNLEWLYRHLHNATKLLKSNKTLCKIIYVYSVCEVRTGTWQAVDLRSWLVGCDIFPAVILVSSFQTNHKRS